MNGPEDGAVALVTGANTGIGRELARQLARSGRYRSVLLGCRDAARGAAARAALEAATGRAVFGVFDLDLSSVCAVRAAAARLDAPVDDLVMNAGGLGGADPFALTRDGVTEIVAANALGHAALLRAMSESGVLRRSAILAGSEAARGVRPMGIGRPVIETGSIAEFVSVCDGSRFRRDRIDRFGAYAWSKLLGALWIGHEARRRPALRILAMSPGGTSGTSGMDVLPQPMRFLATRVLGPYVMPLIGMGHDLETGARRLGDAVLDERFQSGVFYASRRGTTGERVDQAELFGVFGDPVAQDHAAAALGTFLRAAA